MLHTPVCFFLNILAISMLLCLKHYQGEGGGGIIKFNIYIRENIT